MEAGRLKGWCVIQGQRHQKSPPAAITANRR